jgi:uncharacterized membrane protein
MKTTIIKPHQSSIGDLNANIMAMLIFVAPAVLAFIPGIRYVAWAVPLVIFFLEKKSKFVRFYAATSLVISVISFAITVVLGIITASLTISLVLAGGLGILAILSLLSLIFVLAFLALFVFLIVMALSYKQVELPLVGPIAVKLCEKLDPVNTKPKAKSGAKSCAKKTTQKTTQKKKTGKGK